jgi:hypothetical protein
MEMDKSQIEKYQAVRKELETTILKKLDAIKVKILTYNEGTVRENIQILTMVTDELDDVLLNWEDAGIRTISSPEFINDDFDDQYDDDEDED